MSNNTHGIVTGQAEFLKTLLGAHYGVDYYQRDYVWGSKQVVDLVEDLVDAFRKSFEISHVHSRHAVSSYRPYFLGTIIEGTSTHQGNVRTLLVDGQQRITTLTLLLVYLRNKLEDYDQNVSGIEHLICSEQWGQTNFNLSISERNSTMDHLFRKTDGTHYPEDPSSKNLLDRFEDIKAEFPDPIDENVENNKVLPLFTDWLLERVQVIKVGAPNDEAAYTIFETMNDRGLSLGPADMLKGMVLSNIKDLTQRKEAADSWSTVQGNLRSLNKEAEADFFRTWFRSRYADNIEDYDSMSQFHRWFRDRGCTLAEIQHSENYYAFATEALPFYARYYLEIKKAESVYHGDYPAIYYNAAAAKSLDQAVLLLSSLEVTDSQEVCEKKLTLMSRYLDLRIADRLWNNKNLTMPANKATFLRLAKSARTCNEPEELAGFLRKELDRGGFPNFKGLPPTYSGQQKKRVLHILARLSDMVESNGVSNPRHNLYECLITAKGRDATEVEHVLANDYQMYESDFDDENDFVDRRSRLGGLVLLSKSDNASYGDDHWSVKIPRYNKPGTPLLSATLAETCYNDKNPRFKPWVAETGLPFKGYSQENIAFDKSAIEDRTALYRALSTVIWSTDKILDDTLIDVKTATGWYEEYREDDQDVVDGGPQNNESMQGQVTLPTNAKPSVAPKTEGKKVHWATLKGLLDAGLLREGEVLTLRSKKHSGKAIVQKDGKLLCNGQEYDTPSAAASHLCGRSAGGWEYWLCKERPGGPRLSGLREEYEKANPKDAS